MQLRGKTAFITGGARGLGKGFAQSLLEKGARVVLVDVLSSVGLATTREFKDTYGNERAHFILCDVTKKDQLESAFKEAINILGRVDIVVNNAGILAHDDFEVVINVDLTALIRGCLLAMEHMRTDRGGSGGVIVNVASMAGLLPPSFEPIYGAAKHGVVGYSKSVTENADAMGVKVMCLCPSFADTEIIKVDVKSASPGARKQAMQAIKSMGIMRVSEVVSAFDKMLEDGHQGAVLAVTPMGAVYVYPKTLKTSKL